MKFLSKLKTASIICITVSLCVSVFAEPAGGGETAGSAQTINAPSAILVEQTSGTVLYELDADKKLPIASVTKSMTMLLAMEALDSGKIKYTDTVTASEHAASMGGSQIFLEVGEQMSVDDMLKAIAVASGNDAAVAVAEYISGTEEAFVEEMNKRAAELGCKNTHFINCNGLDETSEHYSTARDVALISCELLKHPKITEYTTIWMDTLRGGAFGLSNTNKLIRFYKGANGIKTGSTSTARYCLAASAERDGMQLVAVVLGAPTTADRFESASRLLDYGFANYSVIHCAEVLDLPKSLSVIGGKSDSAAIKADDASFTVKKGTADKIETELNLNEPLRAPVKKGSKIGEAVFSFDGKVIARCAVAAAEDIERIGFWEMYIRLLKKWVCV